MNSFENEINTFLKESPSVNPTRTIADNGLIECGMHQIDSFEYQVNTFLQQDCEKPIGGLPDDELKKTSNWFYRVSNQHIFLKHTRVERFCC